MEQTLPAVLRIEREKTAGSWQWDENASQIPTNLLIADPEYFPENLKTLVPSPQYGETYLKSPFEDKYFLLDEFEKAVLDSKIRHIVKILQLLGATCIEYATKEVGRKQRETDLEINGAIPKGGAELHVNYKEDENTTNKNVKRWEYQGAAVPEYDKAVEYAINHNIKDDCVVDTLLEGRNPSINNRQKSFQETSAISVELNKSLDVACKLNYLKGVLKIDSSFRTHTSVSIERETHFVVKFTC